MDVMCPILGVGTPAIGVGRSNRVPVGGCWIKLSGGERLDGISDLLRELA